MANTLDRLGGHAYAPGHGAELSGPMAEFMSQFDGFFILFCTAGLMFVIVSQYARHRRRRKNLDRMRAHWAAEKRLKDADFGVNPKMRYNAGFWGDG